jgi:hypothetical protein
VYVTVVDVDDTDIFSFSGPGLLSDTAGGDYVDILGANFGCVDDIDPPVTARYGSEERVALAGFEYTAYNCSVLVSNTVVRCYTVAGAGASLVWNVTMVNTHAWAVSTATTAYKPPTLTSVQDADALSTAGNETVVLQGTQLGPLGQTDVRVMYSSSDVPEVVYTARCTVTVAHQELECQSDAGVGSDLMWKLVVSEQSSNELNVGSYAQPTITALSLPNADDPDDVSALDTRGGTRIAVEGANFGSGSEEVHVSFGPTGSEYDTTNCVVTVAHTRVVCDTAPGVGANLLWQVHVAGQTSPPSSVRASYAIPSVTTVAGIAIETLRTEGGELIRLIGDMFGPRGHNQLTVEYGPVDGDLVFTATDCEVTTAHTGMTCLSAPGTGADSSWRVTVAGQASTRNADALTSYSPPIVGYYAGVGSASADTEGGQAVRISGRNFGSIERDALDSATYGSHNGPSFTATNCRVTIDNTQITCDTVAGAGAGLAWAVRVDGQQSTTARTSYAVPVITQITGAGANIDASTDGGEEVVLLGDDFGPTGQGFLESVVYGAGSNTYDVTSRCTHVSHTRITGTTLPGVGAAMQWVVAIAGQRSSPSPTWGYSPPVIASMSPSTFDTSGGAVFTVRGTNFGLQTLNDGTLSGAHVRIKVVSSSGTSLVKPTSVSVDADSDDEHVLEAKFPAGHGEVVRVYVLVGLDASLGEGRLSTPYLATYEAPVLTYIVTTYPTSNCGFQASDGYVVVKVSGENFGTGGTVWVRDGSTTSSGRGRGRTTSTTYGPLHAPAASSGACTQWTHGAVWFIFKGTEGAVTIVVGEDGRNVTGTFRDISPTVLAQGGTTSEEVEGSGTFSTSGGDVLTLYGQYWGNAEELFVTVAGQPCNITEVVATSSSSHLTCTVPAGEGVDNPVVLMSDGLVSQPLKLAYAPPTVTSARFNGVACRLGTAMSAGLPPCHVPTTGASFELWGNNFGDHTSVSFVEAATLTSWTSTHIVGTVPSGENPAVLGESVSVLVTQGVVGVDTCPCGQFNTEQYTIDYDPPTLGNVVGSATCGTLGGCWLEVEAANMGVLGLESHSNGLFIGDLEPANRCLPDTWSPNPTAVRCRVPTGAGTALPIRARIGNQVSLPANQLFSYASPRLVTLEIMSGELPCATVGGAVLRLNGTNLGPAGSALRLWLDTTPYSPDATDIVTVLSHSDTSIVIELPPGAGAGRRVRVNVGGQDDPADGPIISYAVPTISSLSASTGSTDGGYSISVLGTNLGPSGARERLVLFDTGMAPEDRLSPTPIEANALASTDTQLVFAMPAGIGRGHTLRVCVQGQFATAELPWSFLGPEIQSIVPNRPSAAGALLTLRGANFGVRAVDVTVKVTVIGNDTVSRVAPCTEASWARDNNGPFVTCTMAADAVGPRSVWLSLGGQNASWPVPGVSEDLTAVCPSGWWARPYEKCEQCPIGATCAGGEMEPVASAGWWMEDTASSGEMHFLPCENPEACDGGNTCGDGYQGVRCAGCVPREYYRYGGACVSCPGAAWVWLVLFLTALVGVCGAGYLFTHSGLDT